MNGIEEFTVTKEEVDLLVKSVIITSKKDIFLSTVDGEFKQEEGYNIPYKLFDYDTLEEYLESIPGVTLELNCYGDIVVRAEAGNARHIRDMVRNQKCPGIKRKKKRTKSAPGRTETSPVAASNVRKTNNQSIYKSHTDLLASPDSPVRSIAKIRKYPFKTTEDPITDVRGIPFVTVNGTDDEETTEITKSFKITLDPLRGRRVEVISKCVRFEGDDSVVCGRFDCPTVTGFSLMGDDFFFDFMHEYLEHPVNKNPKYGSIIGMAKKKMTIAEAMRISHERNFPDRVVILIGAAEIISGKKFDNIACELYSLIGQIVNSVKSLVVCTIPPIHVDSKNIFSTFLKTNELIRCIPEDLSSEVEIIDLYDLFTRVPDVKFKCNELYCDKIDTGLAHPPKLNMKGQEYLFKLLKKYLF